LDRLGPKLGQLALGFGADELCGSIVEKRALRLGDNAGSRAIARAEAAQLLRGAGLRAFERVAGDALEEFAP
jgi:2-iminoacetate synthase ThiH